jgi:unsaturated rhamnogalacturonyl hydrolase
MNTALRSVAIIALSCAFFAGIGCVSGTKVSKFDIGPWAPGTSPQEIGKRVAENFVARPHSNFNKTTPPKSITYPETCTWYGALTFAQLSGDKELTEKLMRRFEPMFGEDAKLIPSAANVDSTVFGAVPLELYLETKDKRYLEIGLSLADQQWEPPSEEAYAKIKKDDQRATVKENVHNGLSWQSRFWVDDMYMVTIIQTQAYRATHDSKYADRMATEQVAYLDRLQQPNGLFFHAPDVPYFWGRGDGWFAAGMAELLSALPGDHPKRARIMEGYKKMMAALLKYQGEDGMWRQLIDHPEAWPETSCTGMFTFAFITGVKNGWLDETTYGPAAKKGWLGLQKYLDENANIREVCEGTNKRNDLKFYLTRRRNIGDFHGQAPLLWCASALLR